MYYISIGSLLADIVHNSMANPRKASWLLGNFEQNVQNLLEALPNLNGV